MIEGIPPYSTAPTSGRTPPSPPSIPTLPISEDTFLHLPSSSPSDPPVPRHPPPATSDAVAHRTRKNTSGGKSRKTVGSPRVSTSARLGGTLTTPNTIDPKQTQLIARLKEKESRNKVDTHPANNVNIANSSFQTVDYAQAAQYADEYFVNNIQLHAPLYYTEAIKNNKDYTSKTLYSKAYDKEIDQLTKMETWDDQLMDINEVDKDKIINSMFILNIKRDGTYKCRLVARGDLQKLGTYKKELIANTVHHWALMTNLATALDNNMYIIQLDIVSAYLYADIQEELYIRAPPHMNLNNKVMKLKKSLYGLKQSGANWYDMIRKYLQEECGMVETRGWPCVFTKKKGNERLNICLFVDDVVLFASSLLIAKEVVNQLQARFDTKIVNDGVKDGTIEYDILGLEIEYTRGTSMKIGMTKGLEDKLLKLKIDLQPNRKVPGRPNEKNIKDSLVMHDKEYKNKVKWMQRVIALASDVAY